MQIHVRVHIMNTKWVMNNSNLIYLFQAVKPTEFTEITVMSYAHLIVKEMSVTYRKERVLDVRQDGRAQRVTNV